VKFYVFWEWGDGTCSSADSRAFDYYADALTYADKVRAEHRESELSLTIVRGEDWTAGDPAAG
jgi:hypothetical protein